MLLMRHVQVHDGQCHEDERLQGNNQNVEDRPANLQQAAEAAEHQATAVHDRDQDKNHFTGIHVAEQTQRQ